MTIIVNWFGGCTESEIKWASRDKTRLHLITGRRSASSPEQLYYLGQCDAPSLLRRAPTVEDRSYWWGEIGYAPPSLENAADLVETTLASLWGVHFTEGKTRTHPGGPTSIVMHWCKPDRHYRSTKPAGLGSLPTFLFWDGWRWHTGKI